MQAKPLAAHPAHPSFGEVQGTSARGGTILTPLLFSGHCELRRDVLALTSDAEDPARLFVDVPAYSYARSHRPAHPQNPAPVVTLVRKLHTSAAGTNMR